MSLCDKSIRDALVELDKKYSDKNVYLCINTALIDFQFVLGIIPDIVERLDEVDLLEDTY